MDTSRFIKKTVLFGLGLVAGTSTESKIYKAASDNECRIVTNYAYTSSTNFGGSLKYSLEQLKLNKLKLRSLKNLGKNWNNYNAPSIECDVIDKAEKIISNLDYQPDIFPTGRGSIQIEYFLDDQNLVEIEIEIEKIYAYRIKNGYEFEREIDSSQINDIISELYA